MVKIIDARVGLDTHHQAGPLTVAHGGSSRVGQQVDIDIPAAYQERVISVFPDGLFTLFAGGHTNEFYGFDRVGFCPAWAMTGMCIHGLCLPVLVCETMYFIITIISTSG